MIKRIKVGRAITLLSILVLGGCQPPAVAQQSDINITSNMAAPHTDAIKIEKVLSSKGLHNNPNDAMAAFDGDDHTYLEGIEGEENWSFEVKLKTPAQIRDIEIKFYSSYDYVTDFTIEAFDGIVWEIIAQQENFKPDAYSAYCYMRTGDDKEFSQLRMTMEKPAGQPRPLIRNIKFNVAGGNETYYANAKELADEIFSRYDLSIISNHQKCMLIMDWINREIDVGVGMGDTYLDINRKIGDCGIVAAIMVDLAQTVGLEARRVGLYNSPYVGYAHVQTEVKWGGKWRLYDAAFGTFYTTDTQSIGNLLNPNVASLEEIIETPKLAENKQTINVRTTIAACVTSCGEDYVMTVDNQLSEDKLLMYDEYGVNSSPKFFAAVAPAGPIGLESPLTFPAEFTLKGGRAGYGTADESYQDLVDLGKIYAAMYFIGSSFISPNHDYRMTDMQPGKEYMLTIGILEGRDFPIEISGENVEILSDKQCALSVGDTLIVNFKPTESNAILHLRHNVTNGNNILLDYISIEMKP